MSEGRQRAITEFCGDLQRLHRLAGSPSLNRLVEMANGLEVPLHRSTISDKLNAKSLPTWDFVASFVTACRAHAEKTGVPLPGDDVDLARWDALHLRLVRAVDQCRGDNRLTRSVEVESSRRVGRDGPDPPGADSVAGSVVPRQLPAGLRTFAGRRPELAALTALVDHAGGWVETVVVAAIDGMAGVGKSALAVCWGHRQADRFPDGQLYANLRGFGPGVPMTPTEALRGFLDALGVPPHRVPTTVDGQAGLYRSLLAGRRALVVLDNARDSDQVRALLPGTPGCVVLVTSRNRLSGLVTTDGAHPLTLVSLTGDESRDLLVRRIGRGRVLDEPAAVDAILERCAGLPLALSIVAARVASRPAVALADLIGDLDPLSEFGPDGSADDVGLSLAAVFSWSYGQLDESTARLFRSFGIHPAGEVTVASAASLAALPSTRVRPSLAELTRVHLIEERAPNRYGCHDLLRAYAAELGRGSDPDADRRAAIGRLLDHYLHSAHAADRLLEPMRDPIDLPPAAADIAIDRPLSADDAMAWFTREYPALVIATGHAAAIGFDDHAWRLAWTLTPFLDRRANWPDWAETHRIALGAAERLADRPAQAYAHRILGRAYGRMSRLDDAYTHLSRSLALYGEMGDDKGRANAHEGLSWVCEMQDRYAEALDHSERALALLRAAGVQQMVGRELNAVGWCHGLLGDHRLGLAYCEQALAHNQEIGDQSGEAETWATLGHLHHRLRENGKAAHCFHRAVDLFRDLGYRLYEAENLAGLGDAHQALGDLDGAHDHWRAALIILDDLRDPRAGDLRAKLSDSDSNSDADSDSAAAVLAPSY
jgi:tetratricopeptide (TPR) repeat protein